MFSLINRKKALQTHLPLKKNMTDYLLNHELTTFLRGAVSLATARK